MVLVVKEVQMARQFTERHMLRVTPKEQVRMRKVLGELRDRTEKKNYDVLAALKGIIDAWSAVEGKKKGKRTRCRLVDFPPATFRVLEKRAKAEGVALAEVFLRALEESLEAAPPKKNKKR